MPIYCEIGLDQEISLYQELLDCLEQEHRALREGREEEILSLAAAKEDILERLLKVRRARDDKDWREPQGEAAARLAQLKGQVRAAAARNRQVITASLELIQDFLGLLQPPGPGTYCPEGQMEPGGGGVLFHRSA